VSVSAQAQLHLLRVKELQDILTALRMTKSGRKDELVKRLKDMCSSSILVHAAGGRQHVERIISTHYARMAGAIGAPMSPVQRITAGAGAGEGSGHGGMASNMKRKSDVMLGMAAASGGMAAEAQQRRMAAAAGDPYGDFGGLHAVDQGVWARAAAADPFWAAADEPKLAGTPGVVMAPTRLRAQPGTHVQFLERPFTLTQATLNPKI